MRGHVGNPRTGRAGTQGAPRCRSNLDRERRRRLHEAQRAGWSLRSARARQHRCGSGRLGARIDVGSHPRDVTVAGGAVWITATRNNDGIIVRVDPRTNRSEQDRPCGHVAAAAAADPSGSGSSTVRPLLPTRDARADRLASGRAGQADPARAAPSGIALGSGVRSRMRSRELSAGSTQSQAVCARTSLSAAIPAVSPSAPARLG